MSLNRSADKPLDIPVSDRSHICSIQITNNMTLKTELESEKDMSTPESIENFETTTSRLEDSTPSNTNDTTKSGQNNFFNLRSLISKLTQPSLSTFDFVLLVLVGVCLAAFTQDTCDRCRKQGQAESLSSTSCPVPTALRAPQLGTAWVIPQPGIYVVADGRLTRVGDVTW